MLAIFHEKRKAMSDQNLDIQRKIEMRQLATRLDMTFADGDGVGVFSFVQDFSLFKKGLRRRIEHVLTAEESWGKIHILDFTYGRSYLNRSSRAMHTVCFIHSRSFSLPPFEIRPETMLNKFINLFTGKEKGFLGHGRFARRYVLKGKEESLMRHYFRKDVLDYIAATSDWHMEGLGFYLILHSRDGMIPVRDIPEFFSACRNIGQLLARSKQ